MTLAEARQLIGRTVIYRRWPVTAGPSDIGVITSVNDTYVFVRYRSDTHSKATDPRDLTLEGPEEHHG